MGAAMVASMPRRSQRTAQGDVRSRALDAAEGCLDRFGLQKTTIDDIAKAAGVSRATIYRHVPGGRDEIVLAVLLRICERELARLLVELPASGHSLADQLVEGIMSSLALTERDEHLKILFSPEVLGFTGGIPGAGEALIGGLADMIRPMIDAARADGEIDPDLEALDVARVVCHLMVACLVLRTRDTEGEEALRSMLRTFVVRGLLLS